MLSVCTQSVAVSRQHFYLVTLVSAEDEDMPVRTEDRRLVSDADGQNHFTVAIQWNEPEQEWRENIISCSLSFAQKVV